MAIVSGLKLDFFWPKVTRSPKCTYGWGEGEGVSPI